MIYARLAGGLGNQMFQYAAARALALRNDSEVVLDLRDLRKGPRHAVFGLDRFRIRARIGQEGELPPGRSTPLRHALWRACGRSPRFLRERGLGLNRVVLEAGDRVYLHGYWQSEGYFIDAVQDLRAEFDFAVAPRAVTARMMETILATEASVSVHLRRGDYVSVSGGQETHGVCDQAYYTRALQRAREEVGRDLHAFVFSDDPVWARENLRLDCKMTLVDVNDALTAYDDLRLMAACHHHVIANSTFSWWGAWLDARPEKVVIAPRKWFADSRLVNSDILPTGWIAT
jgi:hypothetical protein